MYDFKEQASLENEIDASDQRHVESQSIGDYIEVRPIYTQVRGCDWLELC